MKQRHEFRWRLLTATLLDVGGERDFLYRKSPAACWAEVVNDSCSQPSHWWDALRRSLLCHLQERNLKQLLLLVGSSQSRVLCTTSTYPSYIARYRQLLIARARSRARGSPAQRRNGRSPAPPLLLPKSPQSTQGGAAQSPSSRNQLPRARTPLSLSCARSVGALQAPVAPLRALHYPLP